MVCEGSEFGKLCCCEVGVVVAGDSVAGEVGVGATVLGAMVVGDVTVGERIWVVPFPR